MTSGLSQLGLLLFVASLVAILTRRVHLPYTVGLVLAGMALHLLNVRMQLHLSKELIFSGFLPPLIFEAALCIRWRELRQDLPIVALLATAGVLLAAAITAGGMHFMLAWGWGSAVVFGVLIAATDPVSVIATFKEAGVRGRLRLLIESESLMNDGTAAVAFTVALSAYSGVHVDLLSSTGFLFLTIVGGVLIGAAAGFGFMFLAGRTADPLVEVTLTTLAAYGSFFVAEHYRFSGVLAALTAGLVVGNYRPAESITDTGRQALETFWEYIAFIANSLIFILIGLQEVQQHFSALWWPAVLAIVLVTLGRAATIYPLCGLFSHSRLKVPRAHQHILFWGGLRGALALALALALPPGFPDREAIVTLTFAVVAFSVFAQGLTITPLLRRLRLIPQPTGSAVCR